MTEEEFWAELLNEASLLDPQVREKAAALNESGWADHLSEEIERRADVSAADGDEPATVAMSVEEAVATFGAELIAEFRQSYPELDDISDEELEDLVADVLREQDA
jgi:hypothetical protein